MAEDEVRAALAEGSKINIEEFLERAEKYAPWEEDELWLKEIMEEILREKGRS